MAREINLKVPLKNLKHVEEEIDSFIIIIQQVVWKSKANINETYYNNIKYPVKVREMMNNKRKSRRKCQNKRTQEKTEENVGKLRIRS